MNYRRAKPRSHRNQPAARSPRRFIRRAMRWLISHGAAVVRTCG
uniref:Uncharacterized protein n=1 Tax=uncultured bacterium PG2 TaxID=147491 RepID=Q9AP88_9BACT|nr:hypothetical protein [uncultured bacterium PG2]